MKQIGKARTFFILAIQVLFSIIRKCVIVRCSCRTATPSKSWVEISVRGECCDTPGVTVATTVLNSVSLCTIEA
jgi:hypothetical protein